MTRELAAPPERNYGLILRLQDDGNVIVEDENGVEASPRIVRLLRGQKGNEIRRWLEREVEKLNAEYDACVNLHMATPDPRRLRFPPMAPFDEIAPVAPTPMAVSWLGRLLGRRAKIEAQNEVALARYRDELTQWRACKEQYEGEATEWMRLLNAARSGEQSAMEMLLDVALADIAWPKETEASFDFGSDSSTLDIDVDLPDENDMPRDLASVATRGIKVQSTT